MLAAALSLAGLALPPLLLVLGLLAIGAGARTRHPGVIALGVVWLLFGIALNFGIGTSSRIDGHLNSYSPSR